jgi:hypothetical protein
MPLTDDELRMEVAWKVEAMHADIELNKEQKRWEPMKVFIAGMAATATIVAAVAGSLGYILGRAH